MGRELESEGTVCCKMVTDLIPNTQSRCNYICVVRAEAITSSILERAGPVICKAFLLVIAELIPDPKFYRLSKLIAEIIRKYYFSASVSAMIYSLCPKQLVSAMLPPAIPI